MSMHSRLSNVVLAALLALGACSVPPVDFTPAGDAGPDAMPDASDVVELQVSASAVTVDEADIATFTVRLTAPPASTVLVSIDSADDNRVGVAPTSVQFDSTNWNQSRTITVSGQEDADTEDEAVNVNVSSSVGNEVVAVTVADNDELRIVVTPTTTLQVDEAGTATISARLSAQPSGPVTVSVMSSDTAIAGVSPTMLTFGTGTWDVSQNVVVSGQIDADVANGTATVTLSATGLTPATVPILVVDRDVLGIQTSTTNLGTLNEGGTTTFTVRLTQQPAAATSVAISSSDTGILTAGPTPLSFTTSNWMTPQTVTVNLPQDVDVADETATISLMSTGLTTRTVSASIDDDDSQVVVAGPDPVALDEGMTRTLNVHLQFQPSADVTLTVTSLNTGVATVSTGSITFTPANYATDQAVVVTATQDADAAAGMTTIRVESLPNALTRDVAVAVTDDDQLLIETSTTTVTVGEAGTVMFGVRLTAMPGASVTVSVASGDATVATVSSAMLTFTTSNYGTYQMVTVSGVSDVDLANESLSISLNAAGLLPRSVTVIVNDDDVQAVLVSSATLQVGEGSTGQVGVSLAFMPAANVTVNLASLDGTAATVLPATMTFTPANYATAQNATITGAGDADAINDSTMINLTATGANPAAVTVTVVDDEQLGIETSVANINVNEPSTAQFGVRLTAQPAADTTVMVMSSDVTAATAAPMMLTFTTVNYATYQNVTLTGVSDVDGINDNITVNLTSAPLTARAVNVTVVDDDTQDILLTTNAITVGENGNGTFGVRLASAPASDVVVSVASANSNKATASPSTLTFTSANYATNQTVTVSGVTDLDMANESIAINMTSPALITRTVTTTVTDDDTQVVLSSATGTINLTEGLAGVAVGFSLQFQPAANVTVTLNLGTGLSVAGGNTLTFTPANYATAQNKTISPVNDDDAADVTTSLTATAPSAATATVNFFIDDDDSLTIDVSTLSVAVTEGSTQQFGVRLTAQPPASATVTVMSNDTNVATITAGASLTFTTSNWNTYQNATVSGVQDVDVQTEGANVTVASTGLATRNVGVTVTDDDTITILTTVSSLNVTEGSTASFGVRLSHQPSSAVTVNFVSTAPSLVSIGNVPPSLTFDSATYATNQNVTLNGVNDANYADGTADIDLTATTLTPSSVFVTVLDDDITLTDIYAQMGPAAGGTFNEGYGQGFTTGMSTQMTGNAVTNPFLSSSTQIQFSTPPKSAGNPNWSDLRVTKGSSVATIPRAFYYGQWADSSTGINGGDVYAVLTPPSSSTIVYASGAYAFYRSTNSGVSWTKTAGAGLPQNVSFGSIVVSPTDASHLLGAGYFGLYTSSNGGDSWTALGSFSSQVTCVGMNPANTSQIYVCAETDLWRSTDAGANWTRVATIPSFTGSPMVFTSSGAAAWLATSQGVLRSTDQGVTWNAVNGNLPNLQTLSIAAHPTNSGTAWVGISNGGIWKTTNGGTSWTQASPAQGLHADDLTVSSDGMTLYAAASAGVWKSTDAGVNFVQQANGIPQRANILRSIAMRGSDVYAGAQSAGLFKSANGAQSWARSDNGIQATQPSMLAAHPTTSGTAFVATDAGFYKTINYGAQWTLSEAGIPGNAYIYRFVFMPGTPSTMYAAADHLYRSTDSGATWSQYAATGGLNAIAVDPANPQDVYVSLQSGGDNGGVRRYSGGGPLGVTLNDGLPANPYVTVIYANGTTLLCVESSGVYRMSGTRWVLSSGGLPANESIVSLYADAAGNVYASTYRDTYRSTDGGMTWTLFQATAQRLVWDPSRPATVFIIRQYSGIARTVSNFASRAEFNTGLSTDAFFGHLAIDVNGSTVYAGYTFKGVFRIND